MMKIEVVPDTSIPAGGHAIIRLLGVALLPPGATFRIEPIDEAQTEAGGTGWPTGDLHPLETRQTPDGIELRVGPDVVDAPRLEPGTPVTISVPEGHLSAELIWPDLPPSASGAAAPLLVMTPSRMAAELTASDRARAEAEEAERLAAEVARLEREDADRRAEALRVADAEEARRKAALDEERMVEAARELDEALASERGARTTEAGLAASPGSLLPPMMAPLPSGSAERMSSSGLELSSLSKSGEGRTAAFAPPQGPELPLPSLSLKRANENAATTTPSPDPVELRAKTIEGSVTTVAPPPSRLLAFLAGAGAAGIAAAAILAVLALRQGGIAPSGTDFAKSTVTGQKTLLADAFTAGPLSPRGEIATEVDLPTALRLADYNLHGVDRPIDRAEAEFWLKKAMSLTASHAQLRWAMTQLGTLSAEPVSGAPDYDRARLLWEIAAANGDPVAMCFLGTLFELGLGVKADKAKALDYFKGSRDAGGCPNSDEAITRLER